MQGHQHYRQSLTIYQITGKEGIGVSMDARTLILQTQLLTSCQRMGKWMGEHEYKDTNIANTVTYHL